MDKREFTRYEKDLQVAYTSQLKTPAKDIPGRILNISLGGVYMLSGSILEKDTTINLTFTIKNNEDVKTLSTTGSVLRSGKISDEPEITAKYNINNPDGGCFAVIKFGDPFIELSFMLH